MYVVNICRVKTSQNREFEVCIGNALTSTQHVSNYLFDVVRTTLAPFLHIITECLRDEHVHGKSKTRMMTMFLFLNFILFINNRRPNESACSPANELVRICVGTCVSTVFESSFSNISKS